MNLLIRDYALIPQFPLRQMLIIVLYLRIEYIFPAIGPPDQRPGATSYRRQAPLANGNWSSRGANGR
jgi:hypothetical protein